MSLFSISQKKSASRTTRSARLRSLALETLEARELLSVSQADYEAIRGLYSEFNLPASMGNLNVAEMVATNSSTFNLTTLKSLIDAAAASDGDDLIVVRANDTRNTLTYTDTNNDLTINIPSGKGTLTIVAYEEGSSRSLTLNANMKSRCLTVKSGEVQLGNVFMKNGYTTTGGSAVIIGKSSTYEFGTGGGINNSGTLTTKNVTVSNCNASCKASLDSLYLNTIFSLGAGIYNTGSMSMYASTVTGNKAESSGATLLESTLNGIGGGIYNEGGSMSLYTCSVTGNIAQSDQWETTTTDGETTETIVIQQMGQTGGLYNAGGTVHITSSTVANNTAYMDAGIYNDATQDKTPVGGEMEIIDSVISGHSSQEGAGGIHNNARCTLTITASFIQGNSTKEWGGGIQTLGALTLVNSVVSGNTAVANGGGISVTGDFIAKVPVFEVNIVNTTITGNKVTGDTSSDPQVKGRGAGLYFCGQSEKGTFAQAIVSNSIIVDNLLADASSEDSNIYRDGTGSLTGNNNLSTFTGWTAGTGNNTYNSSIPLFVRNYNFNTRAEGDYQLLTAENSQVINKGSNVLAAAVGLNESSKDVNKSSRINEKTIDIGAYECQGRIVPPEPLDPPSNVTAQTRTATSITVTWSLVEYAYGYKLEYKQSDEETWTPYTGTITMGSMSVSCTITGLVQDKDYSFHVKASGDGIEHADSTQWSEEATAKTHVDTLIVATELDTSDNDDSILSLREAVALAGTSGWGTQIVFASALNGATISLTSDLTIARSITIDAGSLSRGVTLEKYSLIVETGTTAEITQVNIAKVTHTSLVTGAVQVKGTLILNSSQIVDNVTRGIYVDGGNISLYNCIVEKNVPQSQVSWGGGIRANNATVSLIDCVIRQNGDNALIGDGGGIFASNSSVWISGSLIGQNKSSSGGGIYFEGNEKTLSILSSSITGNRALDGTMSNSNGGGIYLASG
ncbi:MAG: fibronectin type III domain-containing protein, partial [Thermoguttaceae bacterium]|nr:fibronectin type III domain-containing protein [Thermoguttaceae bacterium]